MRTKENYLPHVATATVLTLLIFALFQTYIGREPARILADEGRDKQSAVSAGKQLFGKNCANCHGPDGEGSEDGPALNSKPFLSTTGDVTIMSLINSGVPNTRMPSWGQVHGGPLTEEDIRQLDSFIRSWEATAPDRSVIAPVGDASRGAAIFAGTCQICHGVDGKGTEKAPAINDAEHLQAFDSAWYRDTIMNGRPAKGMPTWGTVLSPAQISDVLALVDQWRAAAPAVGVTATVTATTP